MITFKKVKSLKGEIEVPSDKSITHRSFIFSAMAKGKSKINNPLLSRDTLATLNALKMCGVIFEKTETGFIVESNGYANLKEPENIINCENSGTTARLLTGFFAPQRKYVILTGDSSLRRRPMKRVITPLSEMGAKIFARDNNSFLPLTILPSKMEPSFIKGKVKSAQVKSAILLAGLQLDGETVYEELTQTRNHTELMMQYFGIKPIIEDKRIKIIGGIELTPTEVNVPGDFSSAAFFIAAALVFENSEVIIKNVGLNPTRTGLLSILKKMGANIHIEITDDSFEKKGNIIVKTSNLKGISISGDIIANIIDEIPLLGFLGLFANAPLEIRNAEELRVKESDRINSIVQNLRCIGAEVEEYKDGFKVYPINEIKTDGLLKSFDDHRIAMINILLCKKFGNFSIDSISSIDVSFPDFLERLEVLER